MGSIIMNGAIIGRGAVVGAGAVVTENMHVPGLGLVVGLPGKVVKILPEDTYDKNIKWAKKYVQLAKIHKSQDTQSYWWSQKSKCPIIDDSIKYIIVLSI